MAAADAPLLDKMRELIVGGKAFSPHGAALKVADKASGNGTVESKATRLSRRYRQLENNGAQ
jgi:hypothetical protein